MAQNVTVTWVDPVVGNGQAALATLEIIAETYDNNVEGGIFTVGSVAPGVQTFTTQTGSNGLTAGHTYLFAVRAHDTNGLVGAKSAWAETPGPLGAPSAPTAVAVVVG